MSAPLPYGALSQMLTTLAGQITTFNSQQVPHSFNTIQIPPLYADPLFRIRFTVFSQLPPELREKIWKDALPEPRLVELKAANFVEILEDESEARYSRCVAQSDHPALLHTCSESRAVALKRYKLSFEDDLMFPTYFDVERDALLVDNCAMLKLLFCSNYGTSLNCSPMDFLVVNCPMDVTFIPAEHSHYSSTRFSRTAAKYGQFGEVVILKPRPLGPTLGLQSIYTSMIGRDHARVSTDIDIAHATSIQENQRRLKVKKNIPAWEVPKVISMSREELMAKMTEREMRCRFKDQESP